MSKTVNEVMASNAKYVTNFGNKGALAKKPKRGFAILTCMDARLDPAKYAGLAEGDAHVIRNAGGRASNDAIRSLIISHKLTGTKEWFVIHHTNCAMKTITNETMNDVLSGSLKTTYTNNTELYYNNASDVEQERRYVNYWLSIKDNAKSVVEDVKRIRLNSMVPSQIAIYGYIYDCKTGALVEVPQATKVGKPS